LILIVLFGLAGVFGVSSRSGRCAMLEEGDSRVMQCLPDERSLDGWTADDTPQSAGGEDLFLLIDGGAEIFREYGFEQAVFSSYGRKTENGDAISINLEIYEMESPAGAFGIYTFRTSERGERVPIGTCGRLEGYYLNFWKGRFCVSLIGLDPDPVTMAGVRTIAKAVAVRIGEEGARPRLAELLPAEGLGPNGIEYLRGNLALYGKYRFSSDNIFGLTEGATGTYADHTVFLFSYRDETESRKWFENSMDRLAASPDFSGFTRHGNGYSIKDGSGNCLRFEPCRSFIIAVLGTEETSKTAMVSMKQRIESQEISQQEISPQNISPPSR